MCTCTCSFYKWASLCLMSCFHCVCLCSTPVLVLRVQARLWPLPVPAWRSSAVLHSSSATAAEPATTTPTPTAFGLPPLKTMRCLGKTERLTSSGLAFHLAAVISDHLLYVWSELKKAWNFAFRLGVMFSFCHYHISFTFTLWSW